MRSLSARMRSATMGSGRLQASGRIPMTAAEVEASKGDYRPDRQPTGAWRRGVVCPPFRQTGAFLPPAERTGRRESGKVQPRRLLHSLTGHTGSAAAVAFSPNGRTLASGSYDGSARLWDVQTGALVRELQGHTDKLYAAAFSPGRTDARDRASADRTIKLWRVSDGKLLKTE